MSKPWTLPQAQAAVHHWISQWEEGYFSPLSNLARLTEELGELARVINHLHGDKPPKAEERHDHQAHLTEELGDLLFVLITLANSMDVDLDLALQAVMEKYSVRDRDRFTPRAENETEHLK